VKKIPPILKDIKQAKIVYLDRWQLEIQNKESKQMKTVNNYFSIGSDANIALSFHTKRENKPQLFTNRVTNKLWYAWYGGTACFKSDTPLDEMIDLEIDGKTIEISKNWTGIIVLNLQSYAGGTDLWGKNSSKWELPSASDGLLEVVVVNSSLDMNMVATGVKRPKKLAQATTIKITCKINVPVQIDGEPWREDPCVMTIKQLNQSPVLYNIMSGVCKYKVI